ncbi:MAG: hypothetical protein BHW00_07120 [Clostridium sp. 26_22]|nr:MAG: hypothetical protein BHW00_07120 [Clostridium sp. 26_22]
MEDEKIVEKKDVKNEENFKNYKKAIKNEKKYNLLSKLIKTNKLKFIFIILLIVIIVSIVVGVKTTKKKESTDFTYLNQLLEKSSELTSAKLKITGIENYKDAGAMIINRSDFTMVYTATIRAGVELKEVKVEPNNITKEIIITIPKAKVFDCHVNQEDIKYFDEKFALFNVDSKEDANKACALAEQDGIKEAEQTGILEFAETEAEYVIKDILTPALPKGYKLIIKR